ncbi:hypothetical protein ACIRQQ_01075 [Streptomyces fuscichromogenes]|uniref:AraC-like ligand-binding domain-containing protein n=1 Tax=Streptomyces fuscichromogenes TaxID=1324013 RepID=UPI0038115A9B
MQLVTHTPTRSYDLGYLRIYVLRADGRSAPAPPWVSDPDAGDVLYAAIHGHGSVAASQERQETCVHVGDIVFCDPRQPESVRCGRSCVMTVLRVPRRSLGIAPSDLRRIQGVRLACAEGARARVTCFLTALVSEAECRRTRIGDRLARSAVELLAVLVTEWALERRQGHRAELRPGADGVRTEERTVPDAVA